MTIACALALAPSSCFKDPGDPTTTGVTTEQPTTTTTTTSTSTTTTTTTTGCETAGCTTTTTTSSTTGPEVCEPMTPEEGCIVPLTHLTVQEAIDDVEGCPAEIYLEPGTYTGLVTIARDLVISTSCTGDAVLNGENLGTTVTITSGDVTLSGLEIVGGSGVDGGGIYNAGSLLLDRCIVQNNAAQRGAGVFSEGPELDVRGTLLTGNSLAIPDEALDPDNNRLDGAALHIRNATATIALGSVIENNVIDFTGPGPTGYGAGVFTVGTDLTIGGSEIRENTINVAATVNSSVGGGAGVYMDTGGTLTVDTGSVIEGNHVNSQGVTGTVIAQGGGIGTNRSSFSISQSTVANNQVHGDAVGTMEFNTYPRGGGVYVGSAADGENITLTIRESSIENNTAVIEGPGRAGGGGIAARAHNTATLLGVTIDRSLITSNWATATDSTASGGGLFVTAESGATSATVVIVNSTISTNNANLTGLSGAAQGGGVFARTTSELDVVDLDLSNVTITANTAKSTNDPQLAQVGGMFLNNEGSMLGPTGRMRNSILADNLADGASPDCRISDDIMFSSQGHNILGSLDNCMIDGIQNGDTLGQSPELGALSDNGGMTHTHGFVEGTLAHEAGHLAGCMDKDGMPLALDQRGELRPSGMVCDIGAFELQVAMP